jgi:enamine deaminase RidA (YjgF/YER057c/UK114 family)
MSTPEERLVQLGLNLPAATPPRPTIVTARRVGDLVFLSGRGPVGEPGQPFPTGKVGRDLDAAEAKEAAKRVALNLLGALRDELGTLDAVVECVKVTGIVNCAPGFTAIGDVVDGCSELLIDVFGEAAGRHARTTMGAAEMPNDYPVAIDLIVSVSPR